MHNLYVRKGVNLKRRGNKFPNHRHLFFVRTVYLACVKINFSLAGVRAGEREVQRGRRTK